MGKGQHYRLHHTLQHPAAFLVLFAVRADQLVSAHAWHVCQSHLNCRGVILQMTDEHPDLNIGFRFERVPNSGSARRSQVRWRLAMDWGDPPSTQGHQVVVYLDLLNHRSRSTASVTTAYACV